VVEPCNIPAKIAEKRTFSNTPNATKPLLTDRKSSLCCLHIAIYIEEKGV
jgi:hypothetical protein